jgi:DNA-binding NtrC family response regulator
MAKSRSSLTELGRLLAAAPAPVYVIGPQRKLVFCNQALCDWVGLQAEELVGQLCRYHDGAQSDGGERVAAQLCPPPGAFLGSQTRGTVACSHSAALRRREASFLHLPGGGEYAALVVVLGEHDLADDAPPDSAAVGDSADDLHLLAMRLRHQQSQRHALDRLVVGVSPAARRARAQIELAAEVMVSVLISGPPGAGKRHSAAAMHYARRQSQPGALVPLDCPLLGAELVKSAVDAMLSRAERAADEIDTLLLIDVDQIAPDTQAVLAESLGKPLRQVRVVATAARPLDVLVAAGQYRPDLAALLSTLSVELAPLASRPQDVPLAAQVLLEEINAGGQKQLGGFTPESLDLLAGHAWPGNLDELAAAVRAAHAQAEGPLVTPDDLPRRLHMSAHAALHPPRIDAPLRLDEVLAKVEADLLRQALARARGNKARAARLLGINRQRLLRRLEQLGMDGQRPPAAVEEEQGPV